MTSAVAVARKRDGGPRVNRNDARLRSERALRERVRRGVSRRAERAHRDGWLPSATERAGWASRADHRQNRWQNLLLGSGGEAAIEAGGCGSHSRCEICLRNKHARLLSSSWRSNNVAGLARGAQVSRACRAEKVSECLSIMSAPSPSLGLRQHPTTDIRAVEHDDGERGTSGR